MATKLHQDFWAFSAVDYTQMWNPKPLFNIDSCVSVQQSVELIGNCLERPTFVSTFSHRWKNAKSKFHQPNSIRIFERLKKNTQV